MILYRVGEYNSCRLFLQFGTQRGAASEHTIEPTLYVRPGRALCWRYGLAHVTQIFVLVRGFEDDDDCLAVMGARIVRENVVVAIGPRRYFAHRMGMQRNAVFGQIEAISVNVGY